MSRDAPIGVRLTAEEREALERAADADGRKMSALGRKVITDWLRDRGWLKDGQTPPHTGSR